MPRALVIVLLLTLLLAQDVVARPGAVWRDNKVVVVDTTGGALHEAIARQIVSINAAMPKSVPRLALRSQESAECSAVSKRVRKRADILVCAVPDEPDLSGEATNIQRGRVIERARIVFWADVVNGPHLDSLVCEELMHTLTGTPDDPTPSDDTYPREDTSCALGLLDHPGSWDVAFAKKVYKKYGGKERSKHR